MSGLRTVWPTIPGDGDVPRNDISRIIIILSSDIVVIVSDGKPSLWNSCKYFSEAPVQVSRNEVKHVELVVQNMSHCEAQAT